MTLSTLSSKAAFTGNGVTTVFPLPFPFLREADIKVLLRREGLETPLLSGTHYTLSGAGSAAGGSLTMLSAPATGETLVAWRAPAIVQEVDYVENSSFPAETHEAALDLLTMICQSLQEQLGRAVLYPVSTPAGDILDSTEFIAATNANKLAAQAAEAGAGASAQSAAQSAGQAADSAAAAQAVAGSAQGLVKVSPTDSLGQNLSAKLLAGDGLAETLLNPGGAEALSLSVALAANPGLEFAAGLLRVKAGTGLVRSASGLAADVGAGPGKLLQLDDQGRMPAVVGAYTRQQYAVPVVLTGQSGTLTLDADLHQDIVIGIGGNVTFAVPTNPARGKYMTLTLSAASALTLTWNTVFKANADIPLPAACVAGKNMFLTFRCFDGTNWMLMGKVVEA